MISRSAKSVSIVTPEGVTFSLYLAGPTTRFIAWSIDFACIALLMSVMGFVCSLFFSLLSMDIATGLTIVVVFVINFGYGIVLEWFWRGQTIGKRVMKLQVVDAEALPLRFSQVVIRNLFRIVDMLPLLYLVGGLSSVLSSKVQRLGDIAANTIVIRHSPFRGTDFDSSMAGKHNSLRESPHLAARLRQKISPREAHLALQAILRRDDFDPDARVHLFKEFENHFRSLVEFPEEVTFGMSSEVYVRSVVDILFEKKKA